MVGGGGRDCGADFAGCADKGRVGAAGWTGEFGTAFRQTAPGNWSGLTLHTRWASTRKFSDLIHAGRRPAVR